MISNLTKNFISEINEIVCCLNFIEAGVKLKPKLSDVVYSSTVDCYGKELAINFISLKEIRDSNIYNSILIFIYGIYEKFSRELCIRSIDLINSKIKNYSALDKKIKDENIILTGRAFTRINEPTQFHHLSYDELIKNVGTCSENNEYYKLNTKLFGLEHNILNDANLDKLFFRISISLNWDEIAKNNDYKTIFSNSGTRDTVKNIKEMINDFVKKRNNIAHNGTSFADIDCEYLKRLSSFLIIFAKSISAFIEQKIEKLPKK